jgi:predicted RNase H-like nuclease (RuvC/YqgF family)
MDLLTTILTFLTPVATAAAGWFVGKRKTNAEAMTSEMENVERALRIYREMVTDLGDKVTRLETELSNLRKQLSDVLDENRRLRNERP